MKKRKAKKATTKEAKPATPVPVEKGDNPLDFGGLPFRDLKKNLGCA
jgi:hypothetical protein